MTSRVWYGVAVLLFLAGGAGAGWALWSGFSTIGDAIVRIVVPGAGEVMLTEAGTYTIFHERDGVVDGQITNVPSIVGLKVTVTDEASGATVPVKSPSMSMTYTAGGHQGVSVLVFDAPHPGRYRLTGAYDNGRFAPETVLSVDLGLFGRIFRTIALAFGPAALGALSALAIVLVTFFQRRKMSRLAVARVP